MVEQQQVLCIANQFGDFASHFAVGGWLCQTRESVTVLERWTWRALQLLPNDLAYTLYEHAQSYFAILPWGS